MRVFRRYYGSALVFFGVASVLGSLAFLYRDLNDLPDMTVPGRVALLLSLVAMVVASSLLAANPNLAFRIAGIVSLVILVLAVYEQLPSILSRWVMIGPLPMDPFESAFGILLFFGVDPMSPVLRLVTLGVGPLAFVAGARYRWLGLDCFGEKALDGIRAGAS